MIDQGDHRLIDSFLHSIMVSSKVPLVSSMENAIVPLYFSTRV